MFKTVGMGFLFKSPPLTEYMCVWLWHALMSDRLARKGCFLKTAEGWNLFLSANPRMTLTSEIPLQVMGKPKFVDVIGILSLVKKNNLHNMKI